MGYVNANTTGEEATNAVENLVSEWKDRGEKIESLEERIKDLEGDLDTAERRISDLEDQMPR